MHAADRAPKLKTIAALAVAASGVATAQFVPVDLTFVGTGPGSNASISTDGGSSYQSVFAGQLLFRLDAAPRLLQEHAGSVFSTFCIEPESWVATGTEGYSASGLADTLEAAGRSDPIFRSAAIGALVRTAGSEAFEETGRRKVAAALQLAIWDVLIDQQFGFGLTSLSLDAGSFRARDLPKGIRSAFDDLVTAADELLFTWNPTIIGLRDESGVYQDQLVASSRAFTIPATGTVALLTLGGVMGALRRRAA